MTRLREPLGLGAVLAATFMTQVDGFVVNVASPSIQRDLSAGFDQIQFVGAAYVIAFGALLVTGARLGDRAGHRRVFLAGVAGFTVASLLCGLAPGAGLLVAARFLQGAAAAFMAPQVLAIIRATVPDPRRRARAVRLYGVVIGLGVVCGIAGGGALVQADLAGLGWRAALLINVPVGAAILALGALLPGGGPGSGQPLDCAGAALTVVIAPLLLAALVFGPGGAAAAWLGLPAAGVLLAVLAGQQRRRQRAGREPLFPPRVLTAPGMRLSLAAVFVLFATNAGLFLVVTYHLQTGLDLTPLTAALLFVPLGVGFSAGSAASRRLGHRPAGAGPVLGGGLLAAALLGAALAGQAPPGGQPPWLAVAVAVAGLGQGLVVAPLVGGILNRVGPADAGAASGLASTVTQFGLASGVALAGLLYRTVLGAVPGDPAVPAGRHAAAFTATTVLLALSAVVLVLVGARLHRPAAAPPAAPDPVEPAAPMPATASPDPRRTG